MADIIKYYYTVYKPLRLREKLALERGSVPPMLVRGRPRRARAQDEAERTSASASSARSNGAPGASGLDSAAHAVGRKTPAAAPAADTDTIELSDE